MYKRQGLQQAVKEIEIQAEHRGQDDRHQVLQQLHYYKGAHDITKKTHAQRKRPDSQLHHIQRGNDLGGLGKALQPTAHLVLPDGIEKATYTLHSAQGKVSENGEITDRQATLHFLKLTSGVYFLTVHYGEEHYTQKIIF